MQQTDARMYEVTDRFKMYMPGGKKRHSRSMPDVGHCRSALDNDRLICRMEVSRSGSNSVVECHLAKVKVASSNLVSRSKFFGSAQAIAQRAA